MFIGQVTGSVVATQKVDTVNGKTLLLIKAMTVEEGAKPTLKDTGKVVIAIDTVGAGEGDIVIITQGSSARLTDGTKNVPTDAIVTGIIDAIQVGQKEIFKKQG